MSYQNLLGGHLIIGRSGLTAPQKKPDVRTVQLGYSGISYGTDEKGTPYAYNPSTFKVAEFETVEEAEKAAQEWYRVWNAKEEKKRQEWNRQKAMD